MKNSRMIAAVAAVLVFGLVGCSHKEPEPDFTGCRRIAELATLECSYHNVAEIYDDGTNILFGLKVGYKKAWFEYDGTIKLGVDGSKIKISQPDENNCVTITMPKVQVIGLPDTDEESISDIYCDTGLFAEIKTVDQSEAYEKAQEEMLKSAQSDESLHDEASERAERLLEEYVENIGKQCGATYTVKFVEAQ